MRPDSAAPGTKLKGVLSAFAERYNRSGHETAGAELFESLDLLAAQYTDLELNDLTPALLRDFLGRWYLEAASAPRTSAPLPAAPALINSLKTFFSWAQPLTDAPVHEGRLQVLDELAQSLPRALEISAALSAYVGARGGAFTFPEFLTSFEEGGQSAYDVGGAAGEASAREGHFRIVDITDGAIAAEEMIQEERVAPVLFPPEIARLLRLGDIINLELLRTPEGWQITGGGFAYPPGTEI